MKEVTDRLKSEYRRRWPEPDGNAPAEQLDPKHTGRIDRLDRMYAAQRRVMAATGRGSGGYPPDAEGRVAALCTAIMHEAAELQDTTEWKWWKRMKEPFDEARAREELVDILHFAVQAAIVLGMDPDDLAAEYERKAAANVRRQAEGY